jgi:membrane protein DedA with SNARE-associated domain
VAGNASERTPDRSQRTRRTLSPLYNSYFRYQSFAYMEQAQEIIEKQGNPFLSNLLEFLKTLFLNIESGQLPQLGTWSYPLLALLVIIEGPTGTLLGAAAASAGLMRPAPVFLAATMGNLICDSLWYSVGYFGKTEWLSIFGRRFGIRQKLGEHLRQEMHTSYVKILFIAKFTLSFMIPTMILTGLLRIPRKRWFPPLIVADTFWTGLLILVGYYTTEKLKHLEQGLKVAVLAIPILLIVILIYAGQRFIKRWEKENPEEEPSHSS